MSDQYLSDKCGGAVCRHIFFAKEQLITAGILKLQMAHQDYRVLMRNTPSFFVFLWLDVHFISSRAMEMSKNDSLLSFWLYLKTK